MDLLYDQWMGLRQAAVEHANEVLIWRGKPIKRGEMIERMQREGYPPERQLEELAKAEQKPDED